MGVLYTDTLTITRTTLQLDSVRSNDQSVALVGRYADPVFGQAQAQAYLQLRPSATSSFVVTDSGTTNVTAADRIILDSTRLYIPYNGSWYGDTTVSQELVISRLTDTLRSINYDISSTGPAVSRVIGRRTVRLRPNIIDSLAYTKPIVVDNSIGRELLAFANTDATLLSTTTGTLVDPNAFRNQFKPGFLVNTTGSAPAAVFGFTPSSGFITLGYHVQGETYPRYYSYSFSGKRFNQITTNRGGTAIATLRPGQSQATTITGRTYVQPGTGVTTKLQFPSLLPLLKSGRIAVNRADLVITPQSPGNGTNFLPPFMALTEIDANNRLVRSDLSTGAVRLFAVQQAALGSLQGGPVNRLPNSYLYPQIATLDSRTNTYTFQLSGYFQSLVSGVSPNNALAILTPSASALFVPNQSTGAIIDQTQAVLTDRVWRMVLDGKASVKLILFYTKSS